MTESNNSRSDALSGRDLEGISGAVAEGILRAAKEQERAQYRRHRIFGGGYLLAIFLLVVLVFWGWIHRPPQTVVLNASFARDAQVTAVLSPSELLPSRQVNFSLRLDGVENISQLQAMKLQTEILLPLNMDVDLSEVVRIEKLEFTLNDREDTERESVAAPMVVSVSASKIDQVTLSRPSVGVQR